jgi:hypothetical protein
MLWHILCLPKQALQIKNCKSRIANQELQIKNWKSRLGNQELEIKNCNQEFQIKNCKVWAIALLKSFFIATFKKNDLKEFSVLFFIKYTNQGIKLELVLFVRPGCNILGPSRCGRSRCLWAHEVSI